MTWDTVLYWMMIGVLSVGAGTIGAFLGHVIWLVIRPHEHDWSLSVNAKDQLDYPWVCSGCGEVRQRHQPTPEYGSWFPGKMHVLPKPRTPRPRPTPQPPPKP